MTLKTHDEEACLVGSVFSFFFFFLFGTQRKLREKSQQKVGFLLDSLLLFLSFPICWQDTLAGCRPSSSGCGGREGAGGFLLANVT